MLTSKASLVRKKVQSVGCLIYLESCQESSLPIEFCQQLVVVAEKRAS